MGSRVSSRTYRISGTRGFFKTMPNELEENLTEILKDSGEFDKLQADVYCSLFKIMNENPAARPTLPPENILVNSLIHDYLGFNQYEYTQKLLLAESGQNITATSDLPEIIQTKTSNPENFSSQVKNSHLNRQQLAEKLNISGDVYKRPILYVLVEHFLKGAAALPVTDKK